MTRRVERLTVDALAELPDRVRSDLTWELAPVDRRRLPPEEALAAKEAWLSRTLLEWGSCGRVLYVDDRPAGFVLYGPPDRFAGTLALPTAPIDEDAVQLATAEVFEEYDGGGLGRVLMQVMVKDLLSRGGVRAVECIGVRGTARRAARPASGPDDPGSGSDGAAGSLVPVEFLQQVGFRTHRAHPSYPRMRLDLRSVVSWRADLEGAVGRLVAAVRPRMPRPAPAGRVGPQRVRTWS